MPSKRFADLHLASYRIEGHAIISDDDCICDADGSMPASLRRDSDWDYFQAQLDAAAVVITGRHGHEAHPNRPGRRRLVFTSRAVNGFHREGDVGFIDPSRCELSTAFGEIAPDGGIIAVTGGGPVFEYFRRHLPYDAFHLVRAHGCVIASGRHLFPDMQGNAEQTLAGLGMTVCQRRWLSEAERTELLLFSRD